MGAGHGHQLHVHGDSPVHRAPAHLKLLALLAFVVLVVGTPAGWWPAFGVYLAALAAVVGVSRVPAPYLLKRVLVELPFVVFAVLLPFVAQGPRIDVLGVDVSRSGLEAGATLLVKSTLGVLASLTLAATTAPHDLLAGLERLRLPRQLVQIMSFMVRYLDVVTGEMQRMRVAREARGFRARDPRHWPVLARSAGALFIRSYERGERVHLAMLSRGYTGTLPTTVTAAEPRARRESR
jgi:cobalt/nickel transport system permease protein